MLDNQQECKVETLVDHQEAVVTLQIVSEVHQQELDHREEATSVDHLEVAATSVDRQEVVVEPMVV